MRTPFGLTSAPEFQRRMEYCLAEFRDTIFLPYLDDNLVHSSSFKDHLENFCAVLQQHKEHGVKLTSKDYELFQCRVRFLSKMVTVEGYTTDLSEIAPGKALKERTDNNPLMYVLTSTKLRATGYSWVAELADYNFTTR